MADNTERIRIELQTQEAEQAIKRLQDQVKKLDQYLGKSNQDAHFKSLKDVIDEADATLNRLHKDIVTKTAAEDDAVDKLKQEYSALVRTYGSLIREVDRLRKKDEDESKQALKNIKEKARLQKELYSSTVAMSSVEGAGVTKNKATRRLREYLKAQRAAVREMQKQGIIDAKRAATMIKNIEERAAADRLRIAKNIERKEQKIQQDSLQNNVRTIRRKLMEDKKLTASDEKVIRSITERARKLERLTGDERALVDMLRNRQHRIRKNELTPDQNELLAAIDAEVASRTSSAQHIAHLRTKEGYTRTSYQLSARGIADKEDYDAAIQRLKDYTKARLDVVSKMVTAEKISVSDGNKIRKNIQAQAEHEEIRLAEQLKKAKEKLSKQEMQEAIVNARKHIALNGELRDSDHKVVQEIIKRAQAMDKLSVEEKKIIRLVRNKQHENKKLTTTEQELLQATEKYMSASQRQSAAFLRLTGTLGKTWAVLSRARNMLLLTGFATRIVTRNVSKSVDAYVQYERSMAGTVSIGEKFGYTSEQVQAAVDHLTEDGIFKLTDATKALRNLLSTGIGMQQAIKTLDALRNSAAFNRQGMLEYGEAIVGATDGIKNMISRMVDNAGVTKNLSNILKEQAAILGVNTAALSERQKMILITNGIIKEAARFEGDEARMLDTTAGKFDALGVAMDRVYRNMGKLITQAQSFQGFITAITMFGNFLGNVGQTKTQQALAAASSMGLSEDAINTLSKQRRLEVLKNLTGEMNWFTAKGFRQRFKYGHAQEKERQLVGMYSVFRNSGQMGSMAEQRLLDIDNDTLDKISEAGNNEVKIAKILDNTLRQRMRIERQISAELKKQAEAHASDAKAVIRINKQRKDMIAAIEYENKLIRNTMKALGSTGALSTGFSVAAIDTQIEKIQQAIGKARGNQETINLLQAKKTLDPILSSLQQAGIKGIGLNYDYDKGRVSVTEKKKAQLSSGVLQTSKAFTLVSQEQIKKEAVAALEEATNVFNIRGAMKQLTPQIQRQLSTMRMTMSAELQKAGLKSAFGGNQTALQLMAIGDINQVKTLTPTQIKAIQAQAKSVINAYYDAQRNAVRNKYGAVVGDQFQLLNPKDKGQMGAELAALQAARAAAIQQQMQQLGTGANSQAVGRMQALMGFTSKDWERQFNRGPQHQYKLLGTQAQAVNQAAYNTILGIQQQYTKSLKDIASAKYAGRDSAALQAANKDAEQAGRNLATRLFGFLVSGAQQQIADLSAVSGYLGPALTPGKIAQQGVNKQFNDALAALKASGLKGAEYNQAFQALQTQFGIQTRNAGIAGLSPWGNVQAVRVPMSVRQAIVKAKYKQSSTNLEDVRDMLVRNGSLKEGSSKYADFQKMIDQEKGMGQQWANFLPVDQKIKDAKRLSQAYTSAFSSIANSAKLYGHDIDRLFSKVNAWTTGAMQVAEGIGMMMTPGAGFVGVASGIAQGIGGIANFIGGFGHGNKDEGKTARRARTYGTTINRGPTQYTIAPSLIVENQGDVFIGEDGIDAAGKRLGKMVAESMEYGEVSA